MRKTLSVVLLMILMVSGTTCWTVPTLAADQPSITVKVVNGTAGGGSTDGLDVTLTTYQDGTPSAEQGNVTDAQGNFQFSGLSTNASDSYDVKVTYKGVLYTSSLIQLTATNATQTVNLSVYETTTSDAAVQVSSGHMIIVPMAPGLLNIMEIWSFNNTGDRTYIGAAANVTQPTAQFTLPSGATNFNGNTGVSLNDTTGIVTDTLPIIPGASSVAFTYDWAYQGNNAAITLKTDYPTPTFSVLAPQIGIAAKSTTLTQGTPQDFQGTTYLYLTGRNLKSGQNVDIALTISPAAFSTTTSGSSNGLLSSIPWVWVLVAVLALGIVALIAYPRLKRQGVPVRPGRTEVTGSDPEEDALLEKLARLDDKFDAGELPEQEYRERRARTKERLVYLLSKRRGGTNS
jgi:hypothetical protein